MTLHSEVDEAASSNNVVGTLPDNKLFRNLGNLNDSENRPQSLSTFATNKLGTIGDKKIFKQNT